MTRPFVMSVMGLVGVMVVGLLLLGSPWSWEEGVGKRQTLSIEDDAGTHPDGDEPTDDTTRDTHRGIDSATSRDRVRPAAEAATNADPSRESRDGSVDASPTSGVTRGTDSGGPGTIDGGATSGVTNGTASGRAGTGDSGAAVGSGGGNGGGSNSRSRSTG